MEISSQLKSPFVAILPKPLNKYNGNEFCVCGGRCIMHRMRIRMKILLHLMATRKKATQELHPFPSLASTAVCRCLFLPTLGNIILCKISYFTVETHKIRQRSLWTRWATRWPTNERRAERPANCISCCLTTLKAINLQWPWRRRIRRSGRIGDENENENEKTSGAYWHILAGFLSSLLHFTSVPAALHFAHLLF